MREGKVDAVHVGQICDGVKDIVESLENVKEVPKKKEDTIETENERVQ